MAKCPHCGYEGALRLSSATKETAKGAAAGAAVGSLIPVLGTTVGATVGGFLGFLDGTSHYQCKKCNHRWHD